MSVTKTGLIVIIGDYFSKDVIKKEVDKIKHSSNILVVKASEYKPIIKDCFTKGKHVFNSADGEYTSEYYIAAIIVNRRCWSSNIKAHIRVDEQYLLSSKNPSKEFPIFLAYANSNCGTSKERVFNFYTLITDDKKEPKHFSGVSSTSYSAENQLKDIIESFDTLPKISETKSPCAKVSLPNTIIDHTSEVKAINIAIMSTDYGKTLVGKSGYSYNELLLLLI